jgi:ABC-type cobalamin/Fe3+-siderophores transport system ATPase subunit
MKNQQEHLNIQHIDIEDLFGIYTYSIPVDNIDISQLLILYGQNGAGKTTILQIIFNLLSSEKGKGQKTELANTKFKKISINLSNNITISAYRKKSLIGDYFLSLKKGKEIINVLCQTMETQDTKYAVRKESKNSIEVYNFLNKINKLNLSIHFLSDERKVKSNKNIFFDDENDKLKVSNIPLEVLDIFSGIERNNKTFSLSDTLLQLSITRVLKWFETQAKLGKNIGITDSQLIYLNLITELLDDKQLSDNYEPRITKKDIIKKLKKLNDRNQEFINYSLSLDYNLEKFIEIIEKFSENKLEIIENVLYPYIEGIEKQFNAIEDTKNIIDRFITTLNDFYTGKKVVFSIDEDLKYELKFYSTYTNEELKATMLSSGERQLLLLFCNTITAREQASIFIIDEPELSLNVVWQRKLINALLEFSKGSSIQFILASHSIELLSNYSNHVSQLKNNKEF